MSIPNEALQKLAREIESQALQSQQQINIVKSQMAVKQRDIRLLELTATELDGLAQNTNVYEGVGKMFVFSPTSEVKSRLLSDVNELKGDISNLDKKLHYLETTHKNSQQHIEKIFQSGGRG